MYFLSNERRTIIITSGVQSICTTVYESIFVPLYIILVEK